MKKSNRLVLVQTVTSVIVAACFGDSVGQAYAAEKTVRVGSVTVHSTKANGGSWDTGEGAPDLFVEVRVKKFISALKSTSVKQNTYSTTFNEDTVTVSPGQTLQISVWDKDLVSNDLVGSGEYVIDADDFNSGGVRLTCGRVRSLTLYLLR